MVTQQRPTVEQSARDIRNLLLQAKEGTWMNCKLITVHDTMTVNLTLVQCEFHSGKKLSLQQSHQLIGSKMPTSGIWFLIPISRRRANVRFAPLRTRDHWLFYIRFHKQAQQSDETKKRFWLFVSI